MRNKANERCIQFRLALSARQYLSYYRGEVRDVQVLAMNNQQLRFPASALQKFLTHEGIYGRFEIRFDETNRLIGIERLAA